MLSRPPVLLLGKQQLGAAQACEQLRVRQTCTRPNTRHLDVEASKAKRKHARTASPQREPATQETAHVSAPPRIDSNSNVSVRKQQWLVKAKKASEAATHKVPYKQTFRKSKLDPEQRAEEAKRQAEAEEIAQRAFKKSPLAALRNLYGLKGNEHPPVLLVDGYNLLHIYVQHMQESQPKSRMATSRVLEDLRTGLESEMVAYSQARRIKVVIVYDATNRPPDPIYVDIRTSTRTTIPGAVDVVFCSDQSADSWIVKEAEIIRREGKTPHVLVATDDNEIIMSARDRGAYQVPCRDLIGEIVKVESDTKEKMSSGHSTIDQLAYNIRSKHGSPFLRKPRTSSIGPFHILQEKRQKHVEEQQMKREQERAEATAEKNT